MNTRNDATTFVGIRKLARRTDGASAIEYALLLGLMVAMAAGGSVLLVSETQAPFATLAAGLHGEAPKPAAGSAAELTPATSPETVDRTPWTALLVAVFLAAGGVWAVALAVFKLRRPPQPPLAHDEEQALAVAQERYAVKRLAILQALARDPHNLEATGMLIRHVMTTGPLTVSPTMPASELGDLLESHRCRHVLVVEEGTLVGIISDRDVRGRPGSKARDLMTPNPRTVVSNLPVFQAISLILANQISCLPVVEQGRVLGVVTTTDLLMTLQCTMRLLERHGLDLEEEPSGATRISDLPRGGSRRGGSRRAGRMRGAGN